MFDPLDLAQAATCMARYAAGFDPASVSAEDADDIVAVSARVEKMAATVKALAAARAAEGGVGRDAGRPELDLADRSGITVGQAREQLALGERLKTQPELAAAARAGEVSARQAAAISKAAAADPSAERRLIDTARQGSMRQLDRECER